MENNTNTPSLTDKDVTAATAAMWKYNPVPESPEPYPETLCGSGTDDILRVTAASVRGKKHKHDGSNRDDSFAFEFAEGALIAAVSDGAGSRPFSRIGAKAACEAVVKYAKIRLAAIARDNPDYLSNLGKPLDSPEFGGACGLAAETLRGCFAEAVAAVDAAYEKRKDNPEFEAAIGRKPELRDFSCTLLAALVIPAGSGEYLTAASQVGDGAIAAIDGNNLILLGSGDSGDFAGETDFITSEITPESLMSRTRIRRGKFDALMMMTDGVADDYYPAAPELTRLVIDLRLNGVLPLPDCTESFEGSVPEPAAYQWVNDSDVKYALQYAKAVMSETGLSLAELRDAPAVQKKASLEEFGIVHERDRAEQLRVWLDNYVERGSFDDRTLLLIDNCQ